MIIREYSEKDENAVIALWEACELTRPWNDPRKDIARKRSAQPELFLVGEREETIIASAMAGYDGHRGSVFYLAVAPQYQHLGYGKMLMTRIEHLLTSRGCPKINIVIHSSNKKVLAFYDSLGYDKDAVISIGKRLIHDA